MCFTVWWVQDVDIHMTYAPRLQCLLEKKIFASNKKL